MRHIAIICVCDYESLPVGGEVNLLNRLCSVDNEQFGIRYDLIGMSFSREKTGVWSRKRINGIEYRWLPVANYKKAVPLRILLSAGLKKSSHIIASEGYDALYIHSPELFGPIAHLGIPVVYHVHGDPYYTVRMSRFPLLRTSLFVKYYDNIIKKTIRESAGLIWAAQRSMDDFIKKQPDLRNIILQKVDIIHSCCSDVMLYSETYTKNRPYVQHWNSNPIFITVGRLAKVKHIDFIIRIFNNLLNEYPNALLYICGDGEERTSLEKLCTELNCRSKVSFLGALEESEIIRYLKEADIFLFASESEAMSLVVLESLACGVPVVTTDVGDLSTVVIPGKSGYVVADKSENEYALSIKKLLKEKKQIDFSANCKEIAKRYSPSAMADKISQKLIKSCSKEV